MRHKSETTERLSNNFERFNPYAAKAVELEQAEDVDGSYTYALAAIAFEIGQLRYQLSTKVDNTSKRRDTTSHGRP